MFHLTRRVYHDIFEKPVGHITILGLDSAGKTSFLNHVRSKFHQNVIQPIMPTLGQNFAAFSYRGFALKLWDIGGQENFRKSWHHYYAETSALIYVMDSSDTSRITEGLSALKDVVTAEAFGAHVPVCLCLNKHDIESAMPIEEFKETYGEQLAVLDGRDSTLMATSSLWTDDRTPESGTVVAALNWAVDAIKRAKK
ncbi:Small GTPase superfamily, ARF type [Carpediemonas membranifera]|uniref:Small GTPase superfamily, ARF type n=1 Tax=Carpediemonas membranifera TaxID=201153 RepID=A0A8J6E2R9_9EUKA|nr:Small GTPase superfamily, ARF type [Carpediemonas membranifera]|eukprot:KAG9394661.1 Small GTPase superfamily, ARF type [Carpediemonas membranifera]